ncbi:hypothetical protein TI39_contig4193g00010 [Zymoseptoria brevis]|uniref:Uncharacterized protein n=1 Tax=Zymoseptoria brevis TaxID=1047168 RepID=A0A0F4GAT5_9PEZI|nr:hypothetical protein TI39_contig4193g00010 [Zymoseptoria brevis]
MQVVLWEDGEDETGDTISQRMEVTGSDCVKMGRRYNVKFVITQVCSAMRAEVSREIFRNRIFASQFENTHVDSVRVIVDNWATTVAGSYFQNIQGLCMIFQNREA